MKNSSYTNMIVLAGEQAAPNLLPARHFNPQQIYLLHTSFPKSKSMAANLAGRLSGMNPSLIEVDDYDVSKIRAQVLDLLTALPDALVNITGGTKLMSIGALEAARQAKAHVFYVRSQGAKTVLNFLDFDQAGETYVQEKVVIKGTIDIDDYLVAYFGNTYRFTGFGSGPGEAFERALDAALQPGMDEVRAGWKHSSGSLDIDFVIRCNNQIGVIEAKTGKKAHTTEGIKQLALAGGQRFFGTYVRRYLVIDQEWQKETENNRRLAEAIGIVTVELPGFARSGSLSVDEQEKLLAAIHGTLGKPLKFGDSE